MSSQSQSPVIGFLGYSGTVGKSVLPNLLDLNKDGKIKLVILHREGSDLSSIPEDVEKRVVQLDESGLEVNKKAVEGLEGVLSTVGASGLKSQIYLIDALENSKTLKTFVHSDFGANWTDKELEAPGLKVIGVKEEVVHHAEKKGVPLTHLRAGLFDLYYYKFQAAGTDVKNNKVQLFRDAKKNPFRLVTLAYLGYATSRLLLNPSSISGKIIQLYDLQPTGQEIIDVLTKLHGGKSPEITYYTEEQYQEDLKGQFAIAAALKAKWGSNTWGSDERPKIEGWKEQSYEEVTKNWV